MVLRRPPIVVKTFTRCEYRPVWNPTQVIEHVMLEGTKGEFRIWDNMAAFEADVASLNGGTP